MGIGTVSNVYFDVLSNVYFAVFFRTSTSTSTVWAFMDYTATVTLKYIRAPGSNRGTEGEMAMAALPRCAASPLLRQTLSLCVLVQLCIVEGAPGHNRWGVAETPLPAQSQGRTEDYTF